MEGLVANDGCTMVVYSLIDSTVRMVQWCKGDVVSHTWGGRGINRDSSVGSFDYINPMLTLSQPCIPQHLGVQSETHRHIEIAGHYAEILGANQLSLTLVGTRPPPSPSPFTRDFVPLGGCWTTNQKVLCLKPQCQLVGIIYRTIRLTSQLPSPQ